MQRFIEFTINHWELVCLLLGLIIAFFYTESRRAGQTVSPLQATQLINKEDALVLDIREGAEYNKGHITGSINIPFSAIDKRVAEIEKHKSHPIILVCKMGQHSAGVGKTLRKHGFTDIKRLSGGIGGWQADSLPLVK